MWCEKEELRLSNRPKIENFDKAYKQFREERERQRSELRRLENQAAEEKQARQRHIWPGALSLEKKVYANFLPNTTLVPPFFSFFSIETEVSPTKTFIYQASSTDTSNLIFPCPDLRRWSVWFEDDYVTLNQGYRYWFPSDLQHPLQEHFFFSGRYIVDTRFVLEGVVDIGRYGSVTVDVATYVSVVRCNAPDRNHDNGWHNDPNYDQLIDDWRSYCDGEQQRIFSDSQQGLHTFAHFIDLPVRRTFWNGRPNRFVEVTHILTITAVNASCQFGPNREDCATGSSYGWITTQWPTILLEYLPI